MGWGLGDEGLYNIISSKLSFHSHCCITFSFEFWETYFEAIAQMFPCNMAISFPDNSDKKNPDKSDNYSLSHFLMSTSPFQLRSPLLHLSRSRDLMLMWRDDRFWSYMVHNNSTRRGNYINDEASHSHILFNSSRSSWHVTFTLFFFSENYDRVSQSRD